MVQALRLQAEAKRDQLLALTELPDRVTCLAEMSADLPDRVTCLTDRVTCLADMSTDLPDRLTCLANMSAEMVDTMRTEEERNAIWMKVNSPLFYHRM